MKNVKKIFSVIFGLLALVSIAMAQPTATWAVYDTWARNETASRADGTYHKWIDDFKPNVYPKASYESDYGQQHANIYGWRILKAENKWLDQHLLDPMISQAVYHDGVLHSLTAPAYCGVICFPQIKRRSEFSFFSASAPVPASSSWWGGITQYSRVTRSIPRVLLSGLNPSKEYDLTLQVHEVGKVLDRSPLCESAEDFPVPLTSVKVNGLNCNTNGIVTLFGFPGTTTNFNVMITVPGEAYIRWSPLTIINLSESDH